MLKKKQAKKIKVQSFTIVFEPMREGGYNVVIPAIPEICTFGKSLSEAKRMAQDALACYAESILADRKRLPNDIRRAPKIERLDFIPQPV